MAKKSLQKYLKKGKASAKDAYINLIEKQTDIIEKLTDPEKIEAAVKRLDKLCEDAGQYVPPKRKKKE